MFVCTLQITVSTKELLIHAVKTITYSYGENCWLYWETCICLLAVMAVVCHTEESDVNS